VPCGWLKARAHPYLRPHAYVPLQNCTHNYMYICVYVRIYTCIIHLYITHVRARVYIMYLRLYILFLYIYLKNLSLLRVYMCAAYVICAISVSRSIFFILVATSYVRINPYASLNNIPSYHVGILNATKADSRLGRRTKTRRRRRRRRPSPPVNTYIRTCIYAVYMRREERSFLCSFCTTYIGAMGKREKSNLSLSFSLTNRIKRVVSQRNRPMILSRFGISGYIHCGLILLLSRSVIY